uniref:IF rod domain-containing protein n=1 Tax=Glossina brevipalpis TaxID=37001 RepID=A0A1A9WER1_9MUSC
MYQLLATDWSAKYNAIDDDRKKVVAELRQLQREIDNHLNETRRRLEVEILSEMDLEYYTQSLREELTLKDELHVQEINEIRLRHLDEINEIDGRISAQYEEKLHRSLERVRNQYETLMRAKRDEIALMYQQKFEKLLRKIANQANANANVVNKLRGARKRIKVVNKRILKLKSNKAFVDSQIKALKRLRFRYWADLTTVKNHQSNMDYKMLTLVAFTASSLAAEDWRRVSETIAKGFAKIVEPTVPKPYVWPTEELCLQCAVELIRLRD